MPGKTQAQTDAVLNVLRGTNITAPANVYVGLFSVNPADDASAGTELTGAGGYARQAVTFGAPATDTGNGRKGSNTRPISCGPGTRRPLNQTPGTTPATQDITSEHTWNRVESARTIAAGNWSVVADVTTGSGGGGPNRVTCVVERRNSSCVVLETLLNVQSGNLTAGSTQEVTFGPG